jgi:hypothetical protein
MPYNKRKWKCNRRESKVAGVKETWKRVGVPLPVRTKHVRHRKVIEVAKKILQAAAGSERGSGSGNGICSGSSSGAAAGASVREWQRRRGGGGEAGIGAAGDGSRVMLDL